MSAILHPTAVIDPSARLADGVRVGPYCVIGEDVIVGEGCQLGPHAVLLPHTRLGARCRVHAHAVLADWPQDLKFKGVLSRVEVGDECVIREGVTIHRGTHENSATVIGRGCFLMANSHVAHNVTLGDGVILANGALLAGDVQVGDRAFISGNVVIHQFTRIGRLAMLSGLSGIGMDVLPFCTTAGVMRNTIAGLNIVGMRRAGLSPAERLEVKCAFKIVFRSGLGLKETIEALRREFTSGPASEWADFIAGSRRGICRRQAADAPDGEAD